MIKLTELLETKEAESKVVIRLSTTQWHDGNGCYQKKTLRFMRRKCVGDNFFLEDCSQIGADQIFESITNLHECPDGIYTINICDERSSWETPGIIEDYNYRLDRISQDNISS